MRIANWWDKSVTFHPYGSVTLVCDNNSNCFRRIVMVVCSDCETGNKVAFETIKVKLEEANEDPALAFLSILPDCPHVGTSIKAAFSNWC